MLSRTARRSLTSVQISTPALSSALLLPTGARYLSATTQHVESPSGTLESSQLSTAETPTATSIPPKITKRSVPQPPAPIKKPLALSPSVKELLPLLATQPSHYISAHIHGKPYLVTVGDLVRLPFKMPGVVPGDVLRLNRASSLGSRDFTLKGTPYLDERIFECRARVMGTEAEPMRIKEKTKRRNRKIKTVKSKLKFTILRISELKLKDLEEIEQ
ncbi:hypothetical protein QTJ16_000248 [Diplocarpon rosae]|uniref:Large ribosomal subunit protein bL21m n=1 Tax=Diplocarpon rosae TaxID=946125 RepID=A0AAD9T5V6_9HELO|nr:hypothetical protein QTJ16_000248 [Diplocarpon rosae]PBP26185.1 YmL49 [Diplocarpon rosae]